MLPITHEHVEKLGSPLLSGLLVLVALACLYMAFFGTLHHKTLTIAYLCIP